MVPQFEREVQPWNIALTSARPDRARVPKPSHESGMLVREVQPWNILLATTKRSKPSHDSGILVREVQSENIAIA